MNKSRKKGEPQLICKCKGVWKRVFRLSSGSAQQLGGGSRAGSGSLWDVLLLVGVLEALGKSCFFFVFSFGKKVGGGRVLQTFSPLHGLRAQIFKLACRPFLSMLSEFMNLLHCSPSP